MLAMPLHWQAWLSREVQIKSQHSYLVDLLMCWHTLSSINLYISTFKSICINSRPQTNDFNLSFVRTCIWDSSSNLNQNHSWALEENKDCKNLKMKHLKLCNSFNFRGKISKEKSKQLKVTQGLPFISLDRCYPNGPRRVTFQRESSKTIFPYQSPTNHNSP